MENVASRVFTEGLDAFCGMEVCGYLAQTIKLFWFFFFLRNSMFFVPSWLTTVWRDS